MKSFIALGALSSFLQMSVSTLSGFVLSFFVVRDLGHVDTGIWFLYLSVFTFMTFCDFGLGPSLSREIGFASYKVQPKYRLENLYSTVFSLVQVIAFFAIFLLASLYAYIIHSFPRTSGHLTAFSLSFVFFSISILLRLQCNPHLSLMYGMKNVSTAKLFEMAGVLIGLVLAILFLFLGAGLLGLSIAYLLRYAFLFIVSYCYSKRVYRARLRLRVNKAVFYRIYPVCIQWSIMSLGTMLIFQAAPLLLFRLSGPSSVTAFSVISMLVTGVLMVSSVMAQPLIPMVSHFKGQGNFEKIHELFSWGLKYSLLTAVFLCVIIFVCQKSIAQVWLGELRFQPVALSLMLITGLLEVNHVFCAQMVMAYGYVKFGLVALISGAINLVLSYFFIVKFGVVGAALGIVISQLLTNNWYAVFVSVSKLRYSFRRYFLIFFQCASCFLFQILVLNKAGDVFSFPILNILLVSALSLILTLLFTLFGRAERRYLYNALLRLRLI